MIFLPHDGESSRAVRRGAESRPLGLEVRVASGTGVIRAVLASAGRCWRR